jgi:PPOX class probable F420-dependent enzyme
MPVLSEAVRSFIATAPLAHVTTLDPDGTPHVSVAWVGLEGEELVIATLFDQRKLRNLRRDPRIALSFGTGARNRMGLEDYLVLNGTARVTEGGAPALLSSLARIYIGPDVVFPPMPDPPPGFVIRVTVDRVSGSGIR